MIVKYNDNNSYSSPIPPSNGTVRPSKGTIAKKMGAVVRQIFAVPNPFFSMTNHPLHPFLEPKSTVLDMKLGVEIVDL